jgi:hypothetical protein
LRVIFVLVKLRVSALFSLVFSFRLDYAAAPVCLLYLSVAVLIYQSRKTISRSRPSLGTADIYSPAGQGREFGRHATVASTVRCGVPSRRRASLVYGGMRAGRRSLRFESGGGRRPILVAGARVRSPSDFHATVDNPPPRSHRTHLPSPRRVASRSHVVRSSGQRVPNQRRAGAARAATLVHRDSSRARARVENA